MKKQKTSILLLIATLVLSLVGIGSYYITRSQVTAQVIEESKPVVISVEELYPYVIPPQSTLSSVLQKHNVSSKDIHDFVAATKPVYDLGKIRPGVRFQLFYAP